MIFFVEVSLRLIGFMIIGFDDSNYLISKKEEVRILTIGESTTAGSFYNNYPLELYERIVDAGYSNVTVINKGINGTNSAVILSKISDWLKQYSPDIVIGMIGINDGDQTLKYSGTLVDDQILFIQNLRIYKLLRWAQNYLFKKNEKIIRQRSLWEKKQKLKEIEQIQNLGEKFNKEKHFMSGVQLAWLYLESGKIKKFLIILEKLVEIDRLSEEVIGLRLHYEVLNQNYKNAQSLISLIEKKYTKSPTLLNMVGWYYQDQNQCSKAIQFFKSVYESKPMNLDNLNGIIRCSLEMKNYTQAREFLDMAYKYDSKYLRTLYHFVKYHQEVNNYKEANYYQKKVNDISASRFSLFGRKNYLQIVSKVLRNGGIFIVMQYPMRRVANLKEMFFHLPGVYYVENRENFREAISKVGYSKVFSDRFAIDFGHTTPLGDRLIVDNIMETLLPIIKKNRD